MCAGVSNKRNEKRQDERMATGKGLGKAEVKEEGHPHTTPNPRPGWGVCVCQGVYSSLQSSFPTLAKAIKSWGNKVAYKKSFNTKHVVKAFPNLWRG